jgi:quinohemoprotein ethanol dehydrogenase
MQAAPITYRAKGQQYVLAPVGLGGSARLIRPEQGAAPGATGPSRLIAFSLGQSHTSLPQVNPLPQLPEPPEQNASAAQLAHGKKLWTETGCYNCHGEEVKGLTGGSIPDLRYMSRETHREWHAVVLGGSRIKKGMLPFHESLTVEDSEAVHAYVIQRSREDFDFLLRHLRKGSLD